MQTTNDFLDMLKARRGLPSDYALGKLLGYSSGRIANYRKKRSYLEDDQAVLIADMLEIDPALVLANIHAERAKGEVEKRVWQDLIKRLGGVAAALILALCALPSQDGYADTMISKNSMYIMLNHGRLMPFALFVLVSAVFLGFPRFPRLFACYSLFRRQH